MRNSSDEVLIAAALSAREKAYAPYSHYSVGAAVRTRSGRVYTGCNIENASYGATVCAERVALWKAISEGEREFDTLVVVTSNGGSPCGLCRQVIAEFAPDMRIIIADTRGNARETTIRALLPERFRPEDVVGDPS
ncbi:MAG: cytidine deaminase [Anaerolineae bacterium]|nr:cytidine deaminase [Anaerolineae bacterium]